MTPALALVAALALAVLGGRLLVPVPAANAQAESVCNASGNDNDLLYCVWTVEPRFGGFMVDPSDASVLKVLLTGDEPTDAAGQRVLAEVNRLWGRSFQSTNIERADYTIGQLGTWSDLLIADPGALVRAIDLDESTNRLVLFADGVLDATVSEITAHAAAKGIPADAVAVAQAPPVWTPPAPDPIPARSRTADTTDAPEPISEQRLDRALNPFVAGGQISGGGSSSTAAFGVAFVNANGEEEEGFLTAAHCGGDGTRWYAYETGATGNQQVGVAIRNLYSQDVDAQYVKKAGPDHIELGVGLIARPIERNTSASDATQYQRRLDPDNPYFEVSGAMRSAVGDRVHKVGNTTGWTSGNVHQTCVTTYAIGTGGRDGVRAPTGLALRRPSATAAPRCFLSMQTVGQRCGAFSSRELERLRPLIGCWMSCSRRRLRPGYE